MSWLCFPPPLFVLFSLVCHPCAAEQTPLPAALLSVGPFWGRWSQLTGCLSTQTAPPFGSWFGPCSPPLQTRFSGRLMHFVVNTSCLSTGPSLLLSASCLSDMIPCVSVEDWVFILTHLYFGLGWQVVIVVCVLLVLLSHYSFTWGFRDFLKICLHHCHSWFSMLLIVNSVKLIIFSLKIITTEKRKSGCCGIRLLPRGVSTAVQKSSPQDRGGHHLPLRSMA